MLTVPLPCTWLIPNVIFHLVFLSFHLVSLILPAWGRKSGLGTAFLKASASVWQILLAWGNLPINYQKNWRTFSLWEPDEIPHEPNNKMSTKDYLHSKHVPNVFLIGIIPTSILPKGFQTWGMRHHSIGLVITEVTAHFIEYQWPIFSI